MSAPHLEADTTTEKKALSYIIALCQRRFRLFEIASLRKPLLEATKETVSTNASVSFVALGPQKTHSGGARAGLL